MTVITDVHARTRLVDWYRQNRRRSRALFDMLSEDAYYSRPIALRHPVVFYEGHLPAFTYNTLAKKALGRPPIREDFEHLFARGIDPHEQGTGNRAPAIQWPSRRDVLAFADEVDARVVDLLEHEDLNRPGHPLLDRAEAVFSILEHEAMHHETLIYMWHQLPHDQKRPPDGYRPVTSGTGLRDEWIEIPPGIVALGVNRDAVEFGWDNEFPASNAHVTPFEIQRHDITNGAYLEFVEAGAYRDQKWWTAENWAWVQREKIAHPLFWEWDGREWLWRGMFETLPLPLQWPVYLSHAEASAFAAWRGARLMTEAEFQRAAYGTDDAESGGARVSRPGAHARPYPWGTDAPDDRFGVFDFESWDPQPAGSHPAGASAWGVEDLVGNGWEWTSTPFAPFPGFRASVSYPEYSADFFDGEHFVMKGASPATARELIRPSFRNWFRPKYPYVYATFRCVR